MSEHIRKIGKELVEQAENKPSSARGMVDDLFPFIFAASKRMSARAISRWLEDRQQIKLSYTTISKVLKEADERMKAHFFEMRKLENALQAKMPLYSTQAAHGDASLTLLFDRDRFEQMVALGSGINSPLLSAEVGISESSRTDLINRLRQEWYELPEAYREECRKFATNEHGIIKAEISRKGTDNE